MLGINRVLVLIVDPSDLADWSKKQLFAKSHNLTSRGGVKGLYRSRRSKVLSKNQIPERVLVDVFFR